MVWLTETVASSVVPILLTMIAAYLLYLYTHRPAVSVEIMVNTRLATPKIEVVVTNHGRSAVIITELNVHIPAQQMLPGFPSLSPPIPERRLRLFRLRRKIGTQGSRNDFLESIAGSFLSEGALRAGIIEESESIRIEPHEKAARPLLQQKLSPYLLKIDAPDFFTLIPSCKTATQRYAIWGLPVTVGQAGEHPIVMGVTYK